MEISWNFNIYWIGYIKIDVDLKREYRVVIGVVGKREKQQIKLFKATYLYGHSSINVHLLQQAIFIPDQEIHINNIVYSKTTYKYNYLTNCFK